MEEITMHRECENRLNENLAVYGSEDGTYYRFDWKVPYTSPTGKTETTLESQHLLFHQDKPHGEINGISSEALLAALIDRHEKIQESEPPSRDNEMVVSHLVSAFTRLLKKDMAKSKTDAAPPSVQ